MLNKYQEDIQREINQILNKIYLWKDLFFISVEYYFDGWSIALQEKNAYPRRIIVFRSYLTKTYSIKSFEIQLTPSKKDTYKELYFIENILEPNELLKELKEIIYGKDLVKSVKKELAERFN